MVEETPLGLDHDDLPSMCHPHHRPWRFASLPSASLVPGRPDHSRLRGGYMTEQEGVAVPRAEPWERHFSWR